jgi:predicted pyridoxine 5'-phosphate oxidase superfamily flavin-nucleotide-binding protein
MGKMSKEVMEIINDPQTVKVLATVDIASNPNAVIKGSTIAIDDETIAFADIFGDKTNANLSSNRKIALVVFNMPLGGYQIKGTFQGFQKSGDLLDKFTKMLEPHNLGPKAVGTIKVEEVYELMPNRK